MTQKKITFIFPTKNRVKKAYSFVNKNLIKLKDVNPVFLIIVANSFEKKFFKKKFDLVNNVKVVLQNKSGFMNACFESIKYVKTDYCTFLYDDDEISPYAVKIFKKVYKENLSMGYGIVCDQNTKSKFKPININKIYTKEILSAYYGINLKGVNLMPVSPICLVFNSKFLANWKKILLKFCAKNEFRNQILLKQNIGPDLILYLHQIIKKNKISFATPHIAKFIFHKTSMSYILGKNKLLIGYWLAKKSLIELNDIKDKRLNKTIFTFLFLSGVYILLNNLLLSLINKKNYYKNFKAEMKGLKNNKNFRFGFFISLKIIINKVFRL